MSAPTPSPAHSTAVTSTAAPQAAPVPAAAGTSAHRLPRYAALAAAGLLLALLGLHLWLPGWAQARIESLGSERLGRPVSVAGVQIAWWRLGVRVDGLRVAGADASASPVLAIDRVESDLALRSLWAGHPVVQRLVLQAPALHVRHAGQGRWDVLELIQRLRGPDAPQAPPSAGPPLELHDLRVVDGLVVVVDEPVGRTHRVDSIQLGLPFISTHERHRDTEVQPRLAFRYRDSAFDTQAQAAPFRQPAAARAQLEVRDFDLATLADYLPGEWGLALRSGRLDLRLGLQHVAASAQRRLHLALVGDLAVRQLRVDDAAGQAMAAADRIELALREIDWTARRVDLARLTLAQPRLNLARQPDGRVRLGAPAVAPVRMASATTGVVHPSSSDPDGAPWTLKLGEMRIEDAAISVADASVSPPARLALEAVQVRASDLAWPTNAASATATWSIEGRWPSSAGTARWRGQATVSPAQRVRGQLGVEGWALAALRPWLAGVLDAQLQGEVAADADFDWDLLDAGGASAVRTVRLGSVTVAQPRVEHDGTRFAGARRATANDVWVDAQARAVRVGKVMVDAPALRVVRGGDGRWMYESWVRPSGGAVGSDGNAAAAASAGPPVAPWGVDVRRIDVAQGNVSFLDLKPQRPVSLDLDGLRVEAQGVEAAGPRAQSLRMQARVSAGTDVEAGVLDIEASEPVAARAGAVQIKARGLPLQAFVPYVLDRLDLELVRADGRIDARLGWSQADGRSELSLAGDAGIDELRASRGGTGLGVTVFGDDLLRWRALNVSGIQAAMQNGALQRVVVRETALDDFYARVVLQEDGRLNLQDWWREPAPAAPTASAGAAPSASSAPVSAASTAEIQVGPTTLLRGRADFADRFIKPNYSTRLSELTGRLGAFSRTASGGDRQASLNLRGRAEGTATIELEGGVDPVSPQLSFDVRGRMRDLELSPLSPYAVKYAGHGIERGKLSADLEYKLNPDGRLEANNRLVLQQLVFGDPVEGAPTSLPVRLAVALLADRNGVIDIELPISGSLSDPQFSVGALLWRVIGNVVVKAISAPFTLLARAFSSSDRRHETVAFAPGSARLDAKAREHVDDLARTLAERPALRLTIAGSAALDAERSAWQRERLNQLALAEVRPTQAEGAPLEAAAYEQGLRRVLQRADIPKPRTPDGRVREMPLAEVEALLLAHMPVSEETMRELALARSVAVRDALLARGIPSARLYLGAVRTGAVQGREEGGAGAGAAPGPQVDLSVGID